VSHYLARWGLTATGSPECRGPVGTLWVTWHRPAPRCAGHALSVGSPGYLDVVVGRPARGVPHFLCLRPPYEFGDVLDVADRMGQTFGRNAPVMVRSWPAEERALLRAWQISSTRPIRSPFA
jgi:hypothetical protein